MKKEFSFIGLTLPGLGHPSVAIAASRAGEVGVLDLQFVRQEDIERAISTLVTHGRGTYGLRLDGPACEKVLRLDQTLLAKCKVFIITAEDHDAIGQCLESFHRFDCSVFLEATCIEHAELGCMLGVDAIVAKGEEAGGRIGDQTAFVLLQRLVSRGRLPVWVQGGIGLHSVAACYAGGAAGVVLDTQLALCRESALPVDVRQSIARMDGSETVCLGSELEAPYRMFSRLGNTAVTALRAKATELADSSAQPADIQNEWYQAVEERVGWSPSDENVWLIGQDAAFAAALAKRFVTVGGVLGGLKQELGKHIRIAKAQRPLKEGGPLALSHGTQYPIVQGPMTRVSDRAEFAARVAEGGALPLLALALMRGSDVDTLLKETSELLGSRPWGIGILGFVPHELRQEQLEIIRRHRLQFALIAGGRPDQAQALEADGITTYLHVPSSALLRLFWAEGARRFVFEGQECGGHVGPRTSFVLWELMVQELLELLPEGEASQNCHILFAGGVHDAASSAMVAALAAPLAERGVRIGVLLGTAYLFTEEAVSTGAIVKGFQEEAVRCSRTMLLESAPGHATRCATTTFGPFFRSEARRLIRERRSPEQIREALEQLNLGRLRIASKGITRNPAAGDDPKAPRFVAVPNEEQHTDGMYMIGQAAALRDRTCSVADLHREVSEEGTRLLSQLPEYSAVDTRPSQRAQPADVAIIGMSCFLPGASDVESYWSNILAKVNAITEIPPDRWDWQRYFAPDPQVRDKIYSKWGGFLDEIPFDPMEYGIPPSSLSSIEPGQLLALEAVKAALKDAGYFERDFDRENTSVILGVGGGAADLGQQYAFRSALPLYIQGVDPSSIDALPEWTEDTFPGILLNVFAGRVANRFNLGGVNYTVDAACASSLAAVHLGVRELEMGTSSMVIAGGVDTVQNPFAFLCFSKTHALSPGGQCRTFDADADGITISEGLAVTVLKRLADAERDGDKIYAVIKGIAASSDGREKGLTVPRPGGQRRALDRAYVAAGYSPQTVGLIEAHGTGTVVGDRAEVETLNRLFADAGAASQSCALGSVKSMIGHTKCTAGVAGLVKATLALHHKVLPPTMNVKKPNPTVFDADSPLYINSEARPWVAPLHDPRRAGVSAFGFGGTNFHVTLEEYGNDYLSAPQQPVVRRWPSELFYWAGASRGQLQDEFALIENALSNGAIPELNELAAAVWRRTKQHLVSEKQLDTRVAVVAGTLEELREKLKSVQASWAGNSRDVYVGEGLSRSHGDIAFLFPGQGSQYPDMLRDLAMHFSEVRTRLETADRVLVDAFPRPLSTFIYPPPRFGSEEEKLAKQALTATNVAQPALGATDTGLYHLLRQLGIEPTMGAGHSYGEYVALHAAGVFDEEMLYRLSETRGRMIIEAASRHGLGTMAAAVAGSDELKEALSFNDDLFVANLNSPRQTVLSGTEAAVKSAVAHLASCGISSSMLGVACAFHSPLVEKARAPFADYLKTVSFATPRWRVYSNTTGAAYPEEPELILEHLTEHLVRPVNFMQEIEAMYADGARIFVEVGAHNVLTKLTHEILGSRSHLAVATDVPNKDGRVQLQHVLAELAAYGVPVNLDRLFEGRVRQNLDLATLQQTCRPKPLSSTTWMLNGGRARPLAEMRAAPSPATSTPKAPQTSHAVEAEPVRAVAQASAPRTAPIESAGDQYAPGAIWSSPALLAATDPLPEASNPRVDPNQVIARHQQLMSRFLETEKQVMQAFLQAPVQAERTAAPAETVMPDAQTALQPAVSSLALIEPTETVAQPAASLPPSTNASIGPDGVGAPAESAEPSVLDRTRLQELLVGLVAERTGYPSEMLGFDVDIEADLGIDSIKRVEILGEFRQGCGPEAGQRLQAVMEQYTSAKTLGEIIEITTATLGVQESDKGDEQIGNSLAGAPGNAASSAQVGQEGPPESVAEQTVTVLRYLVKPVEAPLDGQSALDVSGKVIVITDDEGGAAEALAASLRQQGGVPVLLRSNHGSGAAPGAGFVVDLGDPDAVDKVLQDIERRHGSVSGIIHLLPLRSEPPYEHLDLENWRALLRREVKSLFYLARSAGEGIQKSGGWTLAATSGGGIFGGQDNGHPFFPGRGGIAGFIKTLAKEWPGVRCAAVDVDPEESPDSLVSILIREMGARDGITEVGYRNERRWALRNEAAPLSAQDTQALHIGKDWVVLITGGIRGITAEVACELAARYQPTLILVGRSPMPEGEEDPETAGLSSSGQIKEVLIRRLRNDGNTIAPAHVEAAYERLLKDREMRKNLRAMTGAGATVRYHQLDVRDQAALTGMLDEIYRTHGRLDAVIHGAGVIEDKLIIDKQPDSFDRVFDTKVDSSFILSRALHSDSLKFLAFFTSVAGRFGNRGQGDYSAANEILTKLALYLDRQWSGRVVAINWGPWESGMASPHVREQLRSLGIQIIPPEVGRSLFDQELLYGRKGEGEVGWGRIPESW